MYISASTQKASCGEVLKNLKIELPYEPTILLLGMCLKNENTNSEDVCTPMLIAGLVTIAKIWKQFKCPSPDEWIKEDTDVRPHTHTVLLKHRRIKNFATKQMDLEDIRLSEMPYRERQILYVN